MQHPPKEPFLVHFHKFTRTRTKKRLVTCPYNYIPKYKWRTIIPKKQDSLEEKEKKRRRMGNNIGGNKKKTKVMKINGEILKLKTPVTTSDVVKDYPGHVLLESEAAKKFGVRAKPLEPEQELKPNKIYFLVELPLFPKEENRRVPRRVKSAVQMSAKDRLECLMLTRRSASDLSILKPNNGPIQLKMKLPRTLVQKLVEESRDETEVAEKIMDLCMPNSSYGS
ncbi:uncharacterized protein At1g66480 [Nicotiana tabacum]|uniref:Uncharacterized protein At1g66480 n=1 Tax=Nicotiana tabacum TaxID=4097 RepID=A0A1S3XLH5_TOBAC|nr:PREDICTED: uncharacterized protein At1g66480-like [Nicotiana tabacum]